MIYLVGIIISLFLLLLIFTKKNLKTVDYILGIWIIVACLNLSTYYLLVNNLYFQVPKLIIFGFTLPNLYPAFLFAYIQETLDCRLKVKTLLFYSTSFLLANVLFSEAYLLSSQEAWQLLTNEGQGHEWQTLLNYLLIIFSGVFFLGKSFLFIQKKKKEELYQSSKVFKQKIQWSKQLNLWISFIWLLVLIPFDEKFIYMGFVLFVIWLGYAGIKNMQFHNIASETDMLYFTETNLENLEHTKDPKNKKSNLTKDQAAAIHQKLKDILESEKVYKDVELSLDSLSLRLEIHPNYLSEVINRLENKNFNEFINELRVEEFILQASYPKNKRFTYLSIAYDCGFNSKASFHRNFKKLKGMTPKEYIEELSKPRVKPLDH